MAGKSTYMSITGINRYFVLFFSKCSWSMFQMWFSYWIQLFCVTVGTFCPMYFTSLIKHTSIFTSLYLNAVCFMISYDLYFGSNLANNKHLNKTLCHFKTCKAKSHRFTLKLKNIPRRAYRIPLYTQWWKVGRLRHVSLYGSKSVQISLNEISCDHTGGRYSIKNCLCWRTAKLKADF